MKCGIGTGSFDKIEVNVDAYKDKRTIYYKVGVLSRQRWGKADIIANVGEAERYGVDGDVVTTRLCQFFVDSGTGNFTFASRYLYFEEAERPGY